MEVSEEEFQQRVEGAIEKVNVECMSVFVEKTAKWIKYFG
jgi:hypothetical protein